MPNYSLTINSKFRPFEYQELLAPVLMATQAHQQLEEQYADLDTKASVWEKLANEAQGTKAYNTYKQYADDLHNAAADLSKYGLNPQSRQSMLNLKGRYSKEILPIEEAYARRAADIKQQQAMRAQDTSRRFNRMAKDMSIDDYMNDPTLDVFSENVSGNELSAQVSKAAQNLKNLILSKDYAKLLSAGVPYQYIRKVDRGATPAQIMQAMRRDPKALPILTNIIDDVMKGSGMQSWSSMNGDYTKNQTYKEMEAMAMRGLYDALGSTTETSITDNYGMQLAAERRAAARAAKQQKEPEGPDISVSSFGYLTPSGDEVNTKKALDTLRAGKQALRADTFGKTGKAPVMGIYKLINSGDLSIVSDPTVKRKLKQYQSGKDLKGFKAEAARYVAKKYGVSKIISKTQYDALDKIGHKDGGHTVSINQLYDKFNKSSTQKEIFSTNLMNYDSAHGTLYNNLGKSVQMGSTKGKVYIFDKNKTSGRGPAVNADAFLSKMANPFDKNSSNKKGVVISDVAYNPFTKDDYNIIVTLGGKDSYVVNAAMFGTEAVEMLRDIKKNMAGENPTQVARTSTIALSKLLNSKNEVQGTTSEKLWK